MTLKYVECELGAPDGMGEVYLKGFVGVCGGVVDSAFGVPEIGPGLEYEVVG